MKISKGQSEAVIRRKTGNTMVNRIGIIRHIMVDKILHRKLKDRELEPTKTRGELRVTGR